VEGFGALDHVHSHIADPLLTGHLYVVALYGYSTPLEIGNLINHNVHSYIADPLLTRHLYVAALYGYSTPLEMGNLINYKSHIDSRYTGIALNGLQ